MWLTVAQIMSFIVGLELLIRKACDDQPNWVIRLTIHVWLSEVPLKVFNKLNLIYLQMLLIYVTFQKSSIWLWSSVSVKFGEKIIKQKGMSYVIMK